MTKQNRAVLPETAALTVRLDALRRNLRTLGRLSGPAAVGAVVKADAYGLGLATVAPALAAAGCETFFVARLEEGVALRALAPRARIFVLDGALAGAAPALIAHRLIPVLNSLAQIDAWAKAARRARLPAALHVDTGMNRLGLPAAEQSVLAAQGRRRLARLDLVLAMSHLACADDPGAAMNRAQLSRFRAALALLPPMPASLAASGGILLGRDYCFDLVRPGLALYGGNPQVPRRNPFAPVALLTARVLQTRRIDKGESVGYAATFRAKGPRMIATVALGYADGIARAGAGRGVAFIRGRRVPFAGRVSMDLLGLDVTELDMAGLAVKPGDEVELFGRNITLEEAAANAGTNAYEVLTGLSRRVPRRPAGKPAA